MKKLFIVLSCIIYMTSVAMEEYMVQIPKPKTEVERFGNVVGLSLLVHNKPIIVTTRDNETFEASYDVIKLSPVLLNLITKTSDISNQKSKNILSYYNEDKQPQLSVHLEYRASAVKPLLSLMAKQVEYERLRKNPVSIIRLLRAQIKKLDQEQAPLIALIWIAHSLQLTTIVNAFAQYITQNLTQDLIKNFQKLPFAVQMEIYKNITFTKKNVPVVIEWLRSLMMSVTLTEEEKNQVRQKYAKFNQAER